MNDSPVGVAAWIVDKFHAWSDLRAPGGEKDLRDVFSMDTLLANIMFMSQRTASRRQVGSTAPRPPRSCASCRPTHIDGADGVRHFPLELRPRPPRGLLEDYHIARFSEFEQGGHFAALEQPDLFVQDVAAFVARVRS